MSEPKLDDDKNNPEEAKPTFWDYAGNFVSLLFILTIVMYMPWESYYKHTLLWDEGQGTAAFLGAFAVLNALSLLVRVRIVEDTNTAWTKLDNNNVTMAISSLNNVIFFAGIALSFIADDLGQSHFLAYLLSSIGSAGHTALYYGRWKIKQATSDAIYMTIFAVILVGMGLATIASLIIPTSQL